MTVDVVLVTRKLRLIAGDLDALAGVASRDRAAFLANRIDQAGAERLLERTPPASWSMLGGMLP